VHTGYGPYDAAYGFGAIWVATVHGVSKLDPRTGRVLAHVDLRNHSEWSNVAVGDGAVWFLGRSTRAPMVLRIDRTTLKPLHTIPLPNPRGAAYEGIAAAGGIVCVGRLGAGPGTICMPEHGGQRMALPGPPMPTPRVAAGCAIWIGGSAITRRDADTRRPIEIRLPTRGDATAITTDRGTVWAAINFHRRASQLWGIARGRVIRRIQLRTRDVTAMTAIAGGVWVMTGGTRPRIFAVRPNGQLSHVATVAADNHALIASPHALWALSYRSGTALRITRTR
jgi:hypothetical protein